MFADRADEADCTLRIRQTVITRRSVARGTIILNQRSQGSQCPLYLSDGEQEAHNLASPREERTVPS